jgi:hypothetical protein
MMLSAPPERRWAMPAVNGRWDGKAIALGNGKAVAQWMAQWAAEDCRQCRSGAIGGNARWTSATITLDGGGVIGIDGGSSKG